MRRGEVWWASLPAPAGSGPGLRRPVVVVQSNPFNESRIATVIITIITSNLALAEAPGNVRIGKAESGLAKPSVVNVSQVSTVDKIDLEKRIGGLTKAALQSVLFGLRVVFEGR